MPIPFSTDDLGRVFDQRVLTRGRSLVLLGQVDVRLEGKSLSGAIEHLGVRHTASLTPSARGARVVFRSGCSCGQPVCAHLAALALAALDRFPAIRAKSAVEPRRLMADLAPGEPPHACFVSLSMVGERSGRTTPATPAKVLADTALPASSHNLARLLGGDEIRTAVTPDKVPELLQSLAESGQARWQATGKRLRPGIERLFDANSLPDLPPKSAVILGQLGPWYVDAATGDVGRVRVRRVHIRRAIEPPVILNPVRLPRRRAGMVAPSLPAIVERPMAPVLRMTRMDGPDETGRVQTLDVMTLEFDYDGVPTSLDDERQFVRGHGSDGEWMVRRDTALEAVALEALRIDGLIQMRVPDGKTARGRRVFAFRGRDAAEQWQGFISKRVPALRAQGWRCAIDAEFGPRAVEAVGTFDMRISEAVQGGFSLDFGIEIDGVRQMLLPILTRLLERGGIDAAQIDGDDLVTSLDDGRIVRLPADRMRRLLAVLGDLLEASERSDDGALVLPDSEAPGVLALEDLLATRWQNAAAIEAYAARFRVAAEIAPVTVPSTFITSLRPYQQQGVDWLQHLRANDLNGFLADDMGLGKTAQTIAHITVEQAAGRLDRPALIVVPTSLVSNWSAELRKFAPSLRVAVLHGLDRHERRNQLDGLHVVITTYTVLARDIEEMAAIPWHMVVLDEAQSIKSPDAKATRAVCQLDTRHRVCLSGTPIENNLEELWSQFAFLMPGLLGDRKQFTKRFRTPIEKKNDPDRRQMLRQRIRPFILRRTKAEVATELPPKHTILRRITLAAPQRELYETIRVMLHEEVRAQIAAHSLARSRIVVLDALLKLRQACCDPRLVKLPSARKVEGSSKLDDLMEMLTEMLAEGRSILIFSQFTSMLDLMKPELEKAGIKFAELRGSTRDRAEPVRVFQAGEVKLFLISLKAGGRGLNLTAADTVIHYDPWWNPAVEDQASDRAHRIGQTKSVFVYKMIAEDTVEERIVELQERKAALARIALNDDDGELPPLEFDEIEYLFGPSGDKLAA